MFETQVLIIGGGPAGSACAIRCRQLGIDCMVADKAKFPRTKLCGGLLTNKTRRAMTDLLGEEGKQELLDASLVHTTDSFSIFYGYQEAVTCKPKAPMQLVSRVQMDNHLFRKAESLGAKVLDDDGLKAIDFEAKIATLSSGTTIHYQYLVAADGAASLVEILLSRTAKDFQSKGHNALVVEVNVKNEDVEGSKDLGIHFGIVRNCYAFSFPRGEVMTYGLAKPFKGKENLKEKLHDFLVGKQVKNIDSYPITGCCIPFYNVMKEPVWHNHLLFAGDAAGLVDPLTGEGICYALQSGKCAADAIFETQEKGADLLSVYADLISPIQRIIKYGGIIERLMRNFVIMTTIRLRGKRYQGFMNFFYDEFVDNGSVGSYQQMKDRWNETKKLRGK